MSTAASPVALPRSPSSSTRRQHAYAPPATDRQHYSPTSGRAPTSPRRSLSTSQPATSTHSRSTSGAQPQLVNVARRDFEQSNLAKASSSSRRSESRDRPSGPAPGRSDSTRNGTTSSRHGHTRHNSDAPVPVAAPPTNGTPSDNMSRQTTNTMPQTARRRTTIDATTGHWELGKTIGAGSMGKVKLARNKETHETVSWVMAEV